MDQLRLRDVLSPPGLLSLARAPLAAAFPFALGKPFAALAILAAAGFSDLLDGWCARRSGRVTLTGAILDPVMDKLFVGTVAVALLFAGRLSFPEALLLGARDVMELPLVAWLVHDPLAFADRSGQVKASKLGKVVTVFQFVAVASALFAVRYVALLAVASGALGMLAGATYWARVLRRAPEPSRPEAPLPSADLGSASEFIPEAAARGGPGATARGRAVSFPWSGI